MFFFFFFLEKRKPRTVELRFDGGGPVALLLPAFAVNDEANVVANVPLSLELLLVKVPVWEHGGDVEHHLKRADLSVD